MKETSLSILPTGYFVGPLADVLFIGNLSAIHRQFIGNVGAKVALNIKVIPIGLLDKLSLCCRLCNNTSVKWTHTALRSLQEIHNTEVFYGTPHYPDTLAGTARRKA